jgi:hypothetical protein
MPLQMNQSAIPVPAVQNIGTQNTQGPFLPPIDKPRGLTIKLAYYLTRRKFGKVPSPIKIHSARLPPAFAMFYGKIGQLDKKLQLPRETVFLIREQVARLNICLFCVDIGRVFAAESSINSTPSIATATALSSPMPNAPRSTMSPSSQETRRSTPAPSPVCPASTPNAPSARSSGSSPANTSTTSPTSA